MSVEARMRAVWEAEQALERRTLEADTRERMLHEAEQALHARSETEAQLREANEQLVVATVSAQAMTEVAELATAQMSFMAEHDYLTGLPNRALLTDRLAQSIAHAQRHGTRVALMYIDLDHFKHINDSLGHAVGDHLLQSVARRLLGCVRGSDTVSRQGGDEFVVLLELRGPEAAAHTAEKLIKALAEPHLIGEHRLHVTSSIGISLFPDDADDVETVVRNADTAMYHAKRNGRNTYQVFTQDMNVSAVARQMVTQSLHHALEHDEFVLHYQPKVNLQTGRITGAEALVRMQPVNQALVQPASFVTIAEDSGLILPIGSWVLREACRQMVQWRTDGLTLGQIAVNVSAVEFRGKDFLAGVQAILKETGLDPALLELELTESGLIQDTEMTTSVLSALKRLGIQIAVDDFGTGYSSLSYLRRFPIDTLKIDRSFIQTIAPLDDNAIISAVIGLGVSLKQRVVAEGIETEAQLTFLRDHHCAEGQGFFFSQPLGAGAFAELL